MKKRVISLLLCLLMALSLIPTTAFASDIATQGGNQNHIDVNISMEVEVNGKKQNLNLQRTDLANLTITNSLGKTFTLNNGFTLDGTSYDKYRNPQFRLVGNFPYTTNWGQEAVNYTLTLKKTIDGVPFEFAATVNIWGENNVCPGNGIDVAFGKGSQVEGVLQLTKVIGINSAALVANKEFTFTVTNKDNSSDVRTDTRNAPGHFVRGRSSVFCFYDGEVIFSPTMPISSRAAKNMRHAVAGSLNSTRPKITAPSAPMPVQMP